MLSTLLLLSTLHGASPAMSVGGKTIGEFYSKNKDSGYFFFIGPPSSPRLSNTSAATYVSHPESLPESLEVVGRLAAAKMEITEVAEAASLDDWDGEGASKVSPETMEIAHRLVELIPSDVVGSSMEIDATPFGSIDFEWMLDSDVMLNVIVQSSGEIGFAYSVHGERGNGSELWHGRLPESVSEVFDKVFNQKRLDG